jgi:WhiB family redox-sensing transcriptional regulator
MPQVKLPGEWADRGSCRGSDAQFFPSADHHGSTSSWAEEALAVCAGCPVRDECLTHALDHDEHGVWGGTTDRDRRRILIADGRAEPRQPYRSTHCKNGHPWTEESTYRRKNTGWRICRTCNAERQSARRQADVA